MSAGDLFRPAIIFAAFDTLSKPKPLEPAP
jgi:hypothetical protein